MAVSVKLYLQQAAVQIWLTSLSLPISDLEDLRVFAA